MACAVQETLPLIMVVEDNLYGISTHTAAYNPYRLHIFNEEHVIKVNARDPFEVYTKGATAVDRARQGGGPTVLWCELDRLSSHTSSDDHRVYRSAEDIEQMMRRDPIPILAAKLIADGELSDDDWKEYQEDTARQVEQDYLKAETAPEVDPG